MKRSPKLLFFVSEDWYFCSHRLSLAVAASKAGYEVVVLTRVNKHGETIRSAGLRLIPFSLSRRGMNLVGELLTLLRLFLVYRREKPDLVHHVAMKPVLYGTLAARLNRVPNVVNALAGMGWLFTSGSVTARFLNPLVRLAFRVLLRPTGVMVQNPDDAALMADLGLPNIHVVRGSGVDIRQFKPHGEVPGVPLVVLPARMLWDKGIGEFVAAARQLKVRGVSGRFALVGAPDKENPTSISLKQLADWQNEGVVEYWGHRDDMAEVLSLAHIVCLPSYREGLPKALLEAAACGRPIVATDATGCREIVRDGENGLLVPLRNSQALADAIERLLNDASLRHRFGQRSRKIIEAEFSLEQIVAETLAVYRKGMSR